MYNSLDTERIGWGWVHPENVVETCAALVAATQPDADIDALARHKARETIQNCDRRLNQYRRVLDEGGDPKTVAGWIEETQADRKMAEQTLTILKPRQSLTEADVRHLIDEVEDTIKLLSEADPAAKSTLYAALGIKLTYDSERKCVRVEAQPRSWGLDRVGGPDYSKPDWRLRPLQPG